MTSSCNCPIDDCFGLEILSTLCRQHIATGSLETYDFCPLRHGSLGSPARNFTNACRTKPGQKPSKSVLLNYISPVREKLIQYNNCVRTKTTSLQNKMKFPFATFCFLLESQAQQHCGLFFPGIRRAGFFPASRGLRPSGRGERDHCQQGSGFKTDR